MVLPDSNASEQAGSGPTGWSYIDRLWERGPENWDGSDWGVVLAVAVPVGGAVFAALLAAFVPPVRRWAVSLVRPPATYGDYAMPRRAVEGRGGEVGRIAQIARSGKRAVLQGGGGRGKSTLARLYVHRRLKRYRGICWIDASTEEGLRAAMVWIAKTLDPELTGETDADVLAARARDLVGAGGGCWLLIYDNAEKQSDLARWLPARRAGLDVLITSRNSDWMGEDCTLYRVDGLDTENEASAGVEVLWHAAGDNSRRDDGRAGALSLARALDGLPLALVSAGTWLRDTPSTRFAEAEARISELVRERPDGEYPDSVYGAVKLSLDRLGPNAALLMKVFAFLAPDDLWPGLVASLNARRAEFEAGQEGWRPAPHDLWALARDRAAVERAFAELERRSLVERGDDRGGVPSWRVHRLTQAVQRAVLAQQTDAAHWRAVAAAVIASVYPHGTNGPAYLVSWPVCARLGPHVAALAADPPATTAMDFLLNQASLYLDAQRLDEPALAYAEEALRLKEARLGPEHEEVGIACNNLAGGLWRLGRHAEAEAMAARAVGMAGTAGIPDAARAAWLSTHGIMAETVGRGLAGEARADKLALAARRYREARAIGIRLHGRASRVVATRLNNLADLRAFQGRWGAALRLHGRALALRQAAPDVPEGDPDVATGLNNLGATLLTAGRAREGYRGEGTLDLLEKALEIRGAALRDGHPDREIAARWLAIAHLALALLGSPFAKGVAPYPGRARALCDAYGLDPAAEARDAEIYAKRARLYESGQVVPPMPGQGER